MPRESHPHSGVMLALRDTPELFVQAAETPTPRSRSLLLELASFGLVGGIAFIVDVGVYNLLRLTLLDDKPIGAKVVSVIVATVVAWLGNRSLTFRQRADGPVLREAALFALANVIGLGVSAFCLVVSHYVLGFTSALADNVAANGVGLVLGMLVRYVAYRHLVFRPHSDGERMTAPASAASEGNPA